MYQEPSTLKSIVEDIPLSRKVVHFTRKNDPLRLKELHEKGECFSGKDPNDNNNNILHIAIQSLSVTSTFDAFSYLISLPEVDKNCRNNTDLTPLQEIFLQEEATEEYARTLLEAGCDPNFPEGSTETALHCAVERNWLAVAALLIEKGVEIDAENMFDETALHVAIRKGLFHMSELLLSSGANSCVRLGDYNCFDRAFQSEHVLVQAILLKYLGLETSLSLVTFMTLMERLDDFSSYLFFKILGAGCHVRYMDKHVNIFSLRFSSFDPIKFKFFVNSFKPLVQELLDWCDLQTFFKCEDLTQLRRLDANLLALLEFDTISVLVERVRSYDFGPLSYLIENYLPHRHLEDDLNAMLDIFIDVGIDKPIVFLKTIVKVMSSGHPVFYRLVNSEIGIEAVDNDPYEFLIMFSSFDSDMFRVFAQQHSNLLHILILTCLHGDATFICSNPNHLERFTKNLLVLLESESRYWVVNIINKNISFLGCWMTYRRDPTICKEYLTQILLSLLSYGFNVTERLLTAIFRRFGYCSLVKTLLHMDIKRDDNSLQPSSCFVRLLFDMNFNIEAVLYMEHDEQNYRELEPYFMLGLNENGTKSVPSLLELARNATRNFIIKKFCVKNCTQYYTVLNNLPIARDYKNIISFAIELY